MKTIIIKIDNEKIDIEKMKIAADIIKNGGLVAFPTETVYGLGANAYDDSAVRKIFIAKGRPSDNPLIVHITEKIKIDDLAEDFPEKARLLADRFWPGPLTMILKKNRKIPDSVTGKLDTIAVRMPSHPIARMLIDLSSLPIAAPSANISGMPSPTKAEHVIKDLYGKIDVIIDGGDTEIGLESTVIDMTKDPPIIYRPGKITVKEIENVIGKVLLSPVVSGKKDVENIVPISPGMKYRHYAPITPLILYEGDKEKVHEKIVNDLRELKIKNYRVGLIVMDKNIDSDKTVILNSDDPENIARRIFSILREMDEYKLDFIFVQGISDRDLGLAIMNRLRKASTKIVKVE